MAKAKKPTTTKGETGAWSREIRSSMDLDRPRLRDIRKGDDIPPARSQGGSPKASRNEEDAALQRMAEADYRETKAKRAH